MLSPLQENGTWIPYHKSRQARVSSGAWPAEAPWDHQGLHRHHGSLQLLCAPGLEMVAQCCMPNRAVSQGMHWPSEQRGSEAVRAAEAQLPGSFEANGLPGSQEEDPWGDPGENGDMASQDG